MQGAPAVEGRPGFFGGGGGGGVAEAGVVEALGGDEQDVGLATVDGRLDVVPVLEVGGVDGVGADAGAGGGLDLVAHEREQRGDDDGRTGALIAEQCGGDEVDRRLSPAGALYDEGPAPADHQGLDRRPLVVAENSGWAGKRAQVLLGALAKV